MNRFSAAAAAAILAAGCADRGIVDVSPQQTDQPNAALTAKVGDLGLTVMTWNVYYGTDPMPILLAAPEDLLDSTTVVWERAVNTNFPERAGALAQLIAANNPDLVGLQEAALYRRQSPSDLVFEGTTPATEVVYDFLQLLVDSLKNRGLHYVVAAADSTTDIEVPVFNPDNGQPIPYDDIRLTDRDAVLVRGDVVRRIVATDHGRYETHVPILIGAVWTGVYEGWSSVIVRVRGQDYRFVSTHLEIQDFPGVGDFVQYAQAQELLDTLSDQAIPTIVVGDFNSDGNSTDLAQTRTYRFLTGARPDSGGFTDSWLRPLYTPPGLTCCQADDLKNETSTFFQRVDFIFTRDMPQEKQASTIVLGRNVVGDETSDKTASGLWPSDHGGVVATFLTSPFGPFGPLTASVAK